MALLTPRRYTAAEYLAFERAAEFRHELVDGRIRSMLGGSLSHNEIVTNLVMNLHPWSREQSVEVYVSAMRMKAGDAYLYPDVMIVCGRSVVEDEHDDTILNPAVIMEVLADNTEAYDRGLKFEQYRRVETVREYILIAQDSICVEQFVRRDEHWERTEIRGRQGVLQMHAVDREIPLRDIYEHVEFSAAEPREPYPSRNS